MSLKAASKRVDRAVRDTVIQMLEAMDEPLGSRTAWPSADLQTAIEDQALGLCESNRGFIVDPQSERLLGFSSAVLAAHRMLSDRTGEPERAKRAIGRALVRAAEKDVDSYLEARLGVRLRDPQTAFDRIAASFIERGEDRFGRSFRYVQDRLDGAHCFVRIETCFFDGFFRAHSAHDLTPLFCDLDIVWAEELQRRCPTVTFSRPTTLAAGDDACRFQFART